MGIHSTKENHHFKSTINENHSRQQLNLPKTKFSIHSPQTIFFGWQEIWRGSHTEWLHGISEFFGFTSHTFTCNSELHNICAPGFCSESLSRKIHHGFSRCSTKKFRYTSRSIRPSSSSSSKSKKLREHFEYNHVPAMISSLQNYSVHGIVNGRSSSDLNHNNETIMLLIYSIILDKTQFTIVDLKLNRHVCTLGDDYNGLIDARKVHAAWSMDRTQVIICVPIGGAAALDFYQIVKKEGKLYRRIYPIDRCTRFEYTPNYWSSRLVFYTHITEHQSTLLNYNITSLTPSGSHRVPSQTITLNHLHLGSFLMLKNTHTWSTYQCEKLSSDETFCLLSILYTSDSLYLILTYADTHCHCGQTLPISYFDIYHGNTLQRLNRLYTQLISHICPFHMCRNFLTPIFSCSSSKMAFCTTKNNGGRELQVAIVVLPNELQLKSICRRLILQYLHEYHGKLEDITNLLPYRLSQYIQYRPEYQ